MPLTTSPTKCSSCGTASGPIVRVIAGTPTLDEPSGGFYAFCADCDAALTELESRPLDLQVAYDYADEEDE